MDQTLLRKDRATSDQNPITLLVGRITSIMSCRATAFSKISFSSEISQAKSNKPRLRLSSLAIALLRTPLTPLNLFAKLFLLSASQEMIERSKVSHCKPSCCSSSRSIARPSRPQKSIKYVVSGDDLGDGSYLCVLF